MFDTLTSRRLRYAPSLAAGLVAAVALASGPSAHAGVIQVVTTTYTPGMSPLAQPADTDTAEVFALTSAGITSNIGAVIGNPTTLPNGYGASSSAGIFGQVGMQVGLSSAGYNGGLSR